MPFHDFALRILECRACGGPLPAPSSGMADACAYCGAPSSDAREVGVFSHDIRVVVCDTCDAPLPVPVAGGHVTCGYCASVFELVARVDRRLGADDPIDEAARIARLRAQDHGPIRMPRDFAVLMKAGGLIDDTIERAHAMWKHMRGELRRERDPKTELRFYYMTELIADYHNWRVQRLVARSYLEAALQDLDDPRYVQPLYCWLSRSAYFTGDAKAARDWLDLCDTRPDELGMDSAYRFTWAYVAVRKGDYADVLAMLGDEPGAIPMNDKYETITDLYRAHAVEHTRGVDAAAAQLRALNKGLAHRWRLAITIAEAETQFDLCGRSLPTAVRKTFDWPMAGVAVAVFTGGAALIASGRHALNEGAILLGIFWGLLGGLITWNVVSLRVAMRRELRRLGDPARRTETTAARTDDRA